VKYIALIALTAALLIGCASKPEVVPSTGPRPATRADMVEIYPKPPAKYERLGMISIPVTEELRWDNRGDANLAFERLKSEAAKRGANGLLLQVEADQYDRRTLAGYKGTMYEVPMKGTPRTAMAEAIWVLEKE
jgi:hypothetical protein